MVLQDIFDALLYGELSQLSLGETHPDNLTDPQQIKLVNHINLGLTALYTRFSLKQRRLTFPLQAPSDTYQLNLPDLLKIEKVETEGEVELSLNNPNDKYSCITPTLNTLRVAQPVLEKSDELPDELKTDALVVTYRANHPRIDANSSTYDPFTLLLELPQSHLQALLYFVAARVHSPLGVGQVEGFAGVNWGGKYEAECLRLETEGVEVDAVPENDRLRRNGWV